MRPQIIDINDRGLVAFCKLRLYLPLDVQRKCYEWIKLATTNFQDSLEQNSAKSPWRSPFKFHCHNCFCLSVFFSTLIDLLHFFFLISHALPEPRSLRYGLIQFFTALRQCSPLLLLVAERVWPSFTLHARSRAFSLKCKRMTIMYSACQVRKMPGDNLGPTAWGMNFGKYSAQNDVCSFDYSTSVRLIKTETDKAFQFLYCLPYC